MHQKHAKTRSGSCTGLGMAGGPQLRAALPGIQTALRTCFLFKRPLVLNGFFGEKRGLVQNTSSLTTPASEPVCDMIAVASARGEQLPACTGRRCLGFQRECTAFVSRDFPPNFSRQARVGRRQPKKPTSCIRSEVSGLYAAPRVA